MSGLGLPDLEHDVPVFQGDGNMDFAATAIDRRGYRNVVEMRWRVVGNLVSLTVHGLREVAATVE